MCLVVFKIFASSVLTHYVLVFCVTLWQPAVFYSVLFLYFRTHIIRKPTNVKDFKHYSQTYCCFGNQFVPCQNLLVQLTMKRNTFEKNCFKLLECKNYCVHFVFQHAYICLILFPLLQFCAAPVSISEGIEKVQFPFRCKQENQT
jgi:hypothetical protein